MNASAAIDFTRVKSDINGNPRYVCHFFGMLTHSETVSGGNGLYELALARARKIGGKKFHNRQFGGGIVFVSYAIEETQGRIAKLLKELS